MYIAKTGSNSKPAYRKGFRFHGVAPISISNLTSRHSNVGLQSYTVEFIYDSYSVSAKQTNQLISNTQSTVTNNPTTNNLWNLTTPSIPTVSVENATGFNIKSLREITGGGMSYAIFGDYSFLEPPKNLDNNNNNITILDNRGTMLNGGIMLTNKRN